jgi:hypothetical protein
MSTGFAIGLRGGCGTLGGSLLGEAAMGQA